MYSYQWLQKERDFSHLQTRVLVTHLMVLWDLKILTVRILFFFHSPQQEVLLLWIERWGREHKRLSLAEFYVCCKTEQAISVNSDTSYDGEQQGLFPEKLHNQPCLYISSSWKVLVLLLLGFCLFVLLCSVLLEGYMFWPLSMCFNLFAFFLSMQD